MGDKSRWPTFLIQEGGLGLQEVGQGAADCPILVDPTAAPRVRALFELGDDLVGDLLVQAGSVREGTSGQVPGGSWASLRGGRAKASLAPTAPVTDPAPPFP